MTFEDAGEPTKITVLWEPLEVSDEQVEFFMHHRAETHMGWSDTFDKIEKTVEGLQSSTGGGV